MPSKRFFCNNLIVNTGTPSGLPALEADEVINFEQFGPLFKHCKDAHLPRPSSNLRLGTLSEYRRIENEAVRDGLEGIFKVTLNFSKKTYVKFDALKQATLGTLMIVPGTSRGNLNANFFNGRFTNGSVYSTDSIEFEAADKDGLNVLGSVDILAEGADAYVLCMSTSKDDGAVILDPEYDSVWSIKSGSVEEFAGRIATYLCSISQVRQSFCSETIGPLNAPGFPPPPQNEYMQWRFSAEIWEVIYREKTIEMSTTITDEIIQDIFNSLDRSAFIKPEEFSHEKEVRIIFRPVMIDTRDGRRYLFPNYLNPIFIPFDPLLGFVESS